MTEPIYSKRVSDPYATRRARTPVSDAEVHALSDGDLDRKTADLRIKVAKPLNYAERAQDECDLATFEKEGARRDQESRAQTDAGVAICKRPADLPVIRMFADHWWLRTSTKEVGMGNNDGTVPGNAPPRAWDTRMVDHRADHAERCDPVPNVDEACVNRELQEGKPTGKWLPPFNDCHTVVNDVLDACRVPLTPATPSNPGADAGAPIAGAQ
jgi:hypothetical protein